MPNFNLEVSGFTKGGLKCDGAKYTELFKAAYKHTAENGAKLKVASDAFQMFWKKWDELSAPYHTGVSGIKTYSAPFLEAIGEAFRANPGVKAEKSA